MSTQKVEITSATAQVLGWSAPVKLLDEDQAAERSQAIGNRLS